MKLKKVAALCSSANAFCLFDRVDGDGVVTQWLGDGCCAFSLHGLPVLSEPELYRMFDVSEKKQDKIYFNHSALPEGLNVLHSSMTGRIQTLIIRGEPAQTAERLAGTKPLLCDLLPLSLEEIFMYELGGSGYDVKKLML